MLLPGFFVAGFLRVAGIGFGDGRRFLAWQGVTRVNSHTV
jgi:hypothetical protein